MKTIKMTIVVSLLAAAAAGCIAQKGEAYEDEGAAEREVPQTQVPIWK